MLELTESQREELTRWSRSRTLPAREVFVAQLILSLAEGKSYSRIEVELNTSRPTIARWKTRFERKGMAGLETLHKGSKPRTVTPAVQAKVLLQLVRDGHVRGWDDPRMPTLSGIRRRGYTPEAIRNFCGGVEERVPLEAEPTDVVHEWPRRIRGYPPDLRSDCDPWRLRRVLSGCCETAAALSNGNTNSFSADPGSFRR